MKPAEQLVWGPFPGFRVFSIALVALLAACFMLVLFAFKSWSRQRRARVLLTIYLVALAWGCIYMLWSFPPLSRSADVPYGFLWLAALYLPAVIGAVLLGGLFGCVGMGGLGMVLGAAIGLLPYVHLGMYAHRKYVTARPDTPKGMTVP